MRVLICAGLLLVGVASSEACDQKPARAGLLGGRVIAKQVVREPRHRLFERRAAVQAAAAPVISQSLSVTPQAAPVVATPQVTIQAVPAPAGAASSAASGGGASSSASR